LLDVPADLSGNAQLLPWVLTQSISITSFSGQPGIILASHYIGAKRRSLFFSKKVFQESVLSYLKRIHQLHVFFPVNFESSLGSCDAVSCCTKQQSGQHPAEFPALRCPIKYDDMRFAVCKGSAYIQ